MKSKIVTILSAGALFASLFGGTVHAAGSASYSLSPASGTYTKGTGFSVQVHENGDNVNVVTAKLTYDASKLTCTGVSGGSAFANNVSTSCANGNVTISRYTAMDGDGNPTTVSGDQVVGTIAFTAAETGTAAVAFASNSQIASGGNNIWNGNTAGGTYTISTPATGGSGGGSGGTGGGSTGSGGSNSGSTNTGTSTSAPRAAAPTTSGNASNGNKAVADASTQNAQTTAAPADAKKDDTKKPEKSDDKKADGEKTGKKSGNGWLWWVILVAAAAAAYAVSRRSAKDVASTEEADTSKTDKTAKAAAISGAAAAAAKSKKAGADDEMAEDASAKPKNNKPGKNARGKNGKSGKKNRRG